MHCYRALLRVIVFGNTVSCKVHIGKLQPRMWRCPDPAKELKVLGLNLSPFSKAESFIYLSTMADRIGELCPFKDGLILQSQPAQALPKVEQFLPCSVSTISMKLLCRFANVWSFVVFVH